MNETTRLVEADQKATVELITRLIGAQTATRAAVIPIASALAGLGIANGSPALALAGLPVVMLAVWTEGRAGWLQREAHARATYLEKLVQAHLNLLAEMGRPIEAQAARSLRAEFDGYQYGTSRSLRRATIKDLARRLLRQGSTWFYGLLMALLVVAAFVASASAPQPMEACLQTESGAVVVVEGDGVELSGEVRVIPCPRQ